MAIHLKDSNKANNQDSFKIHSKIAETICEIIKNSDLKECSFNMGLFGSWGSGKSFIINRIEESLSKEKYLFLNIDVWKFIGNPLLRSILFDINKQLKEKADDIFPNGYEENHRELESILYYEEKLKDEIPLNVQEQDKKIKNWFRCYKPWLIFWFAIIILLFILSIKFQNTLTESKDYWIKLLDGLFTWNANFIGIIAGMCVFLFFPLKKLGELVFYGLEVRNYKTLPNFSPEQFERIFSNIANTINKNKKKLIIVFDNLDRCEPKYAYETLSTIKTFMDIKNCFYIVPCDDNAVKQYIANNYSILQNKENAFANTLGAEFFDKLFDTYIRIPILEEIDRDKFIEEQLKQIIIYDELKDNIREIRQILYYGYKGSTPRQIKKFINDFSTYYLLAKNIDVDKQFLLKNIPFFAIMLVIKQKWNSIENELIQVPQLTDNPKIKDNSFKDFINKVSPIIPRQLPSLLPFIYLKETTNEQYINEKLKNGEMIENFNEHIYKRINAEIENILSNKDDLYILQVAHSLFATYMNIKDIAQDLKLEFVKTIGKMVCSLDDIENFASFLSKNQKNIDAFYDIFNNFHFSEQNIVKSYIVSYLNENETAYEENQSQLLDLILEDKSSIFKKEDIQPIFSKITGLTEINKSIQNYIKIICKHNKQSFLPQSFMELIINSITTHSIPEQTKSCLNSFDAIQLPEESRKMLSKKTYDMIVYLNSRMSYNSPDITTILANVVDCARLLYKTDFTSELYNNTMNLLYSILERLNNSNDTIRKEYACDLIAEMCWFIDDDKKFSNLLNLFAKNNKGILTTRIKNKNFKYIEEAFKYPETQKVLLNDTDISNCIYEEHYNEIPKNYLLFLCNDCNINNLENLLKTIQDKNIKVDKTKLRDDIIQKYKETGEVPLIINALKILNDYGYNVTKRQYLDIKNKLIGFYKTKPKEGIVHLNTIKAFIPIEEYNTNILTPIFNYIKLELDAANSVANYTNIIHVVNEAFINNNFDLLKSIINALSDDNQDIAEYELCLNLIQLLKNAKKMSTYLEKSLKKEDWNLMNSF